MILIFFLIHLLLYLCILKRFIITERNIFLYHVFSLMVSCCYCMVFMFNHVHHLSESLTWCGIVMGIQGIYSISFLELWSLTEGSYSISILRKIFENKDVSIQELENIGKNKQAARVEDLIRLNLIKRSDTRLELTCFGGAVSMAAQIIVYLSNTKMVE